MHLKQGAMANMIAELAEPRVGERELWGEFVDMIDPPLEPEEAERREFARYHMRGFVPYTYPQYKADPFHDHVCNHIDRVVFDDHPNGHIKHLMLFAPPQVGKPVSTDSLILMGDGKRKRLGDIRIGDCVITHLGRKRKVLAVHKQGELEVLQIVAHSGREIRAAADHPFLTPEGWTLAGNLKEGMALANLPIPKVDQSATVGLLDIDNKLAQARLAGYFVGDGSTAGRGSSAFAAQINCFDPVQLKDVLRCTRALGFKWRKSRKGRYLIRGGVRPWLRQIDLAVKTSWTKRVPAYLFKASTDEITNFIGAYFACDGTINSRGDNRRSPCLEFYSVNRDLLTDIQHLLLRTGIQSRIRIKRGRIYGRPHISWRLSVGSMNEVAKFVERIPVYGIKSKRLKNWDAPRTLFDQRYLPDPIVSIEPAGKLECRCLTIEDDSTFTANDFVVHNSHIVSFSLPGFWLAHNPNLPVLLTSYGTTLARRNSMRARTIFESDFYAELYQSWGIVKDKKQWRQDTWHLNDPYLAYVFATGLDGPLAGQGFGLGIIDDPIKSWAEAQSETMRENAWQWFHGSYKTRMWEFHRTIVMLTRWHEDDVAARIIENEGTVEEGGKWDVLAYPALAESQVERDAAATTLHLSPGLPDPLGREEGEALAPSRYSAGYLKDLRDSDPGGVVWGAEYQQHPTPAKGDFFVVGRVKIEKAYPLDDFGGTLINGVPVGLKNVVRFWDLAASEKKAGTDPDFTSGTLVGIDGKGFTWILHQISVRVKAESVWDMILQTAKLDGKKVRIRIEQEPGAAGKSLVDGYIRALAGYHAEGKPSSGDKRVRAYNFSAQLNMGNVRLLEAMWNRRWLVVHSQFPYGKFDDEVDSTSGAFNTLTEGPEWTSMKFMAL